MQILKKRRQWDRSADSLPKLPLQTEHCGLCSSLQDLVVLSVSTAQFHHADDTTTPIWTNGKDTRFKKIADTEAFTTVTERSVSAEAVGK